jgi:hypothetical protein
MRTHWWRAPLHLTRQSQPETQGTIYNSGAQTMAAKLCRDILYCMLGLEHTVITLVYAKRKNDIGKSSLWTQCSLFQYHSLFTAVRFTTLSDYTASKHKIFSCTINWRKWYSLIGDNTLASATRKTAVTADNQSSYLTNTSHKHHHLCQFACYLY